MTDNFIKNARNTLSLSGSDWYLHQDQDGEAKLQDKDPEGKGRCLNICKITLSGGLFRILVC